jgi:outer membrane receptor protein involved in Fe transport
VLPGDGLPIVIGTVPNPDYQTESFRDVEAGYRLELGRTASIDVTTFRGHYAGLGTNEPLAPVVEMTPGPPHVFIGTILQNHLQADTAGVEIAARMTPLPVWRVDGWYSTFNLTPHPDAVSADPAAVRLDGNAPAYQWLLHSSFDLGRRTQIDGTIFRTGALAKLLVPSYTRADVRVEVKLTTRLSAVAAGNNLLSSTHPEFDSTYVVVTRVPPSALIQLVWRY